MSTPPEVRIAPLRQSSHTVDLQLSEQQFSRLLESSDIQIRSYLNGIVKFKHHKPINKFLIYVMTGIRPTPQPVAQSTSYARMAAYNLDRQIPPRTEHSKKYKGKLKHHSTHVEKLDTSTDPNFVPPSTQSKLLFNPYTHQVTGKPRKSSVNRDWTKYYIKCTEVGCKQYHLNTKEPYFTAFYCSIDDHDEYTKAHREKRSPEYKKYSTFFTKEWYDDKVTRRERFCKQHNIPFQIAPILKPFEVEYVQQHRFSLAEQHSRMFNNFNKKDAMIHTFMHGPEWIFNHLDTLPFGDRITYKKDFHHWSTPPDAEPWQLKKLAIGFDTCGLLSQLEDWYNANIAKMKSSI